MYPKVSVIIPIYNVEKYLKQCLDSVTRQTLHDIQIICIDDGSTDLCPQILDEYANLDERIKVIHKSNTGYGDTLNIGLSNACGEYIGIVESDDFADPDMFEKMYVTAKKSDADIVKSNFYFYTRDMGDSFCELSSDLPYLKTICPRDYLSMFFMMSTVWSAIYNRAFLKNHNILFNNTPGASFQDFSFSFKLWYSAEKVVFVRDAFLHYRRDNPMSSIRSPKKLHCIFDEYNEIDRFIASKGIRFDKTNAILTKLKFETNRDNYCRIAMPFQYYFLKLVYDDLWQLKKEDRFDDSLLTEFENDTLNNIMYHCDEYFQRTCKDYHDDRLDLYEGFNNCIYALGFKTRVLSAQKICIYGAGKIANRVTKYLCDLGINKERLLYVVTDPGANPPELDYVPVKGIKEATQTESDTLFLVSVAEKNMLEILQLLEQYGISDIVMMDNRLRKALKI